MHLPWSLLFLIGCSTVRCQKSLCRALRERECVGVDSANSEQRSNSEGDAELIWGDWVVSERSESAERPLIRRGIQQNECWNPSSANLECVEPLDAVDLHRGVVVLRRGRDREVIHLVGE